MAETAITDRLVPGLAAMEPSGDLVKRLNMNADAAGTTPNRYAIVSSFKADLTSPGFTKGLVSFIADRVTDRIFKKERNDLVVDSASMTDLGGRKFTAVEDYGETPKVYHTIYFAQELVAQRLAEWLGFGAMPAGYTMQAAEIPADIPFANALLKLSGSTRTAPVLIRRRESEGDYLYVRRVSDFADFERQENLKISVRDVFQLHETDSAIARTMGASRIMGGINFAGPVRIEGWDGPSPLDDTGDALVGPEGVIGVRMKPPRSIQVSRDDRYVINVASATRGSLGSGFVADAPGSVDAEFAEPGNVAAATPGASVSEAASPALPSPLAETVSCDFTAQMEPRPKLTQPAELTIRISRQAIEFVQGPTAKKQRTDFKVSERIIILVVPQSNCALATSKPDGTPVFRKQVDVPAEGQTVEEKFLLTGIAEGRAEIVVEAWQGGAALVQLLLEPVFVGDKPLLEYTAKIGLFSAPRSDTRLILRLDPRGWWHPVRQTGVRLKHGFFQEFAD